MRSQVQIILRSLLSGLLGNGGNAVLICRSLSGELGVHYPLTAEGVEYLLNNYPECYIAVKFKPYAVEDDSCGG